jgi:caffeoyl-CoA O-methyltransferase
MAGILTDDVAAYLADHQPPADDLVEEMEAHADRDGVPIADRSVATLQAVLATATGADRALEFGTAIGYSTLHVARTGTHVVTMEVDDERTAAAEGYLQRDGVPVTRVPDPADAAAVAAEREAAVEDEAPERGHVTVVEAPALELLPELDGPFGVAFLDAVKGEYWDYLAGTVPLVESGGMVLADNLLWSGDVAVDDADVPEDRQESTDALRAFNEAFLAHDDLTALLSPLGDGTGIALVE